MTASYIAMIIAAALLLGMAVDILLNSTTILNVAAFLLIVVIAVVLGLQGLYNYLYINQYFEFARLTFQLRNAMLLMVSPGLFFFALYYPRGIFPDKEKQLIYVYIAVFSIMAVLSGLGLDIDKLSFQPSEAGIMGDVSVQYKPVHILFQIINGLGIVSALGYLISKYLKAKLIYQRKQIRYFIFGTVSILTVIVLMLIFRTMAPSLLKNLIQASLAVGFAAYVLFSVTRFKIINIRQGFLKVLRVFLIHLILAIPLVLLLLLLRTWISKLPIIYFFLIVTPVMVIMFRVYDTLIQLSSRLLIKQKEIKDITESLLDEIGTSRNLQELSAVSIEEILSLINSSGATFLIFNEKSENYETLYSSTGTEIQVPAFEPLYRHLEKGKSVYDREVISLDPRFAGMKEMALRYCETYQCQLIIPLFIEKQLYGLIHIMDKYDNSAYSRDDKLMISKFTKVIEVILNNMILSFKEQEAKLTNKDLSLASQIQESIFQKEIPLFPQMDVFAYQKPAKWVNGDYYLVEKVDDNKMGLIIADVSGKGVPAALISMVIHSVSRSQNFSSTTTNAIVSKINEVMTSHMSETGYSKIMSFATLFCGFIDRKNRTLFYTNAAHFPMIIHDRDTDSIVELKANAKPLGIFSDQEFYTETYDLQPHQTLILYSDGITEANDEKGEEFSLERLIEIIKTHKASTARELSEIILEAVEDFAYGQEQFDDITLIIVKL